MIPAGSTGKFTLNQHFYEVYFDIRMEKIHLYISYFSPDTRLLSLLTLCKSWKTTMRQPVLIFTFLITIRNQRKIILLWVRTVSSSFSSSKLQKNCLSKHKVWLETRLKCLFLWVAKFNNIQSKQNLNLNVQILSFFT